jgi:hypothetical protein
MQKYGTAPMLSPLFLRQLSCRIESCVIAFPDSSISFFSIFSNTPIARLASPSNAIASRRADPFGAVIAWSLRFL